MRRPRLGTVLLTLWAAMLTVFVCAYVVWLQPARLAGTISTILESTFKVRCDMGTLSLSLLPMPTVTIDDLALRRGSIEHLEFRTRRARVQVSWFSLLRLKPIVRTITLDSPTLDLCGALMAKNGKSDKSGTAPLASFDVPDVPRYITGLRLNIIDGTCRFTSADGKDSLTVSGIELSSRLPGLLPGSLEAGLDTIRWRLASGIDLSAQGTKLALGSLYKNKLSGEWDGEVQLETALQLDALDAFMGHRISDPYRYFPMPEPLRLSLYSRFSGTPEQGLYAAKGRTALRAVLPMNGHPVPISLDVPFDMDGLARDIAISHADARMGDDRITIDGRLCGLTTGNPVLKGRADLHHFSLTRWFGFGRLMDPGLQKALDNISGEFEEFELSLRGVVVPRLKAVVEGIRLAGSGSCTEFLKPVVRIDAHAQKADLNQVFTELKGVIPDLSYLPPPVLPLTESSNASVRPGTTGITVGYDIHISATEASIMNFRVKDADVHVIPAPRYGTMLTIDVGDVYGGKADSKVYLQDKVRITADLANVSLAGPSAALAGYPVLTGLLKKAKADISFLPGNGITMLTTLGGKLDAAMEKGGISVKGSSSIPYQTFSVNASAKAVSGRGASTMPPIVDFLGRWDVALKSDRWTVKVDAPKASLGFSTVYGLPCLIRDQNMKLDLTLDKSLFPSTTSDLLLGISGKASFDAARHTLNLNEGQFRHPYFSASGSAAFSDIFSTPTVKGQASFSTADLRKAVSSFGTALPDVNAGSTFGAARLNASYRFSSGVCVLENMNGMVDGTSFTGRFQYDWSKRKTMSGQLRASYVDLDRYLPKPQPMHGRNPAKEAIPLDFLRDTDMRLDLYTNRLRAFSTLFTQVSLPVTQERGTLSVPIKASLPDGGAVTGHGEAVLLPDGKRASVSLQARAAQVNMLGLTQGRGQKTLISGIANADASLHSTQHYWDDWRHTLDGFFSFLVSNGALISPSKTPEGQPTQSRTGFQRLSMSGSVLDGIVTCKDFRVLDSLLDVTGGGTVDLGSETIDAKATITVAGIPELPLSITGDLMAPKTNYKLLGAVTGTVGNIGSTLFDLLGNVISAPFKIIMGKSVFRSAE
ncbi:hypothetical protein [Mailhella sp.]|uniref:hypothetical protein n=1 Tax=Mailhella sp. TaxID=1981029 RepID=UPI004063C533